MSETKTVLIIDDDPDFLQAIRHLLESRGHSVQMAQDGQGGFDLAKEIGPDLILLDVMMRERTEGFFTLERIRATPSLQRTPVIVISSIYTEHPGFRVDPGAGWLPADLFLAKPVEPARLIAEVERLMQVGSALAAGPGSAAS
ncbi:MAG TPA: response regulator [Vicinamibacterales bacterium]|nr:response regulator [Vicinamibacterales bacterium]